MQVVGPFAATSFAAGGFHTCAQTSGSDQCWGDDRFGQVGDGAPIDASRPNAAVTNASSVSKIVAGWYQSCAQTNTNAGLCWGSGTFGEVGNLTNTDINVTLQNVEVSGLVLDDITSEFAHACASGTGIEARCWGWNAFGQLGDGTQTSASSGVLVVNNTGANYTAIDAGYEHTCALFDSAQVWCWGRNDHGQLGDGTATDALTMVSAGGFAQDLSAGQYHTCIINTGSGIGDGDAECWGRNEWGQVGDASNVSRSTRVIVSSRSRRYTSISTGDFHSCAVQSATAGTDGRPAGTGWCWGLNNQGELGNGTFTDANEPVEVAGGLTWSVIDAGDDLTCGITTDDDAYCWGSNNFGQLGDGTYFDSNTPQLVLGGNAFAQIDAGFRHTCAITTGGAPFCWGSNRRGEHGNGTVDNRLTPSIVPPGASRAASGSASVSLGLGWRLSGRRFTLDQEDDERPPRRNDP